MRKFISVVIFLAGIAAFSAAQTTGTDLFRQEGIASWYGKEFDGKPTASGETFDSMQFTAAHPSLPFGTILVVTNKQNNHRVTVRINDRGPFVATRIIDVSMAAAEVLDMIHTGTAPVLLEPVATTTLGPVVTAPAAESAAAPAAQPAPAEPAETRAAARAVQAAPAPALVAAPAETPEPEEVPAWEAPVLVEVPVPQAEAGTAAAKTVPSPASPAPAYVPAAPATIVGGIPVAASGNTRLYRLQVGAFTSPKNAVDAYDKLKNARLSPAYERYGNFYRVVLAGLKAADIPQIAQMLGDAGFHEAIIREETFH